MSKNKFEVGDRVAVYDNGCRYINTIMEIDGDWTEQSVLIGDNWYHPKQLRRLKPKAAKAPESKPPRELMTDKHYECVDGQLKELLSIINSIRWDISNMPEQLPPGSAVVTREQLEIAWDACLYNLGVSVAPSKCSADFTKFCKALGLSPKGKE